MSDNGIVRSLSSLNCNLVCLLSSDELSSIPSQLCPPDKAEEIIEASRQQESLVISKSERKPGNTHKANKDEEV